MPFRYERAYYRLQYPIKARPVFTVDGTEHVVLDLSEEGLRFLAADGVVLALQQEVKGIVDLRASGPVEVAGRVVRLEGHAVAVKLEQGVPLSLILEEQRFLHQRFKGWA